MVQILTEHEFDRIDGQNWQLALKADNPSETYQRMRREIEEAMTAESQTLSPEQQTWYRES